MNGNTPYAGLPGVTGAGQRAAADVPECSVGQKRALHRDVSRIAARTRELLPDEYVVDSEISQGVAGPQVTVAVRPPIGRPVSAGFSPDLDLEELGEDATSGAPEGAAPDERTVATDGPTAIEEIIDAADRDEVARGLAASAALQVKQALNDSITPTAR